jgi:hypothetical protein
MLLGVTAMRDLLINAFLTIVLGFFLADRLGPLVVLAFRYAVRIVKRARDE